MTHRDEDGIATLESSNFAANSNLYWNWRATLWEAVQQIGDAPREVWEKCNLHVQASRHKFDGTPRVHFNLEFSESLWQHLILAIQVYIGFATSNWALRCLRQPCRCPLSCFSSSCRLPTTVVSSDGQWRCVCCRGQRWWGFGLACSLSVFWTSEIEDSGLSGGLRLFRFQGCFVFDWTLRMVRGRLSGCLLADAIGAGNLMDSQTIRFCVSLQCVSEAFACMMHGKTHPRTLVPWRRK